MNASPISLMTTCLALPTALVALVFGGCSTEDKGPTYAELVVIYNAELESLDRLESKKRRLIAEYEEKNAPNSDNTAKALAGLLETAKQARDEQTPETPVDDPDKALDKAIADTEQLTGDLLESAAQSLNQEAPPVAYSEEFKQQLAVLDQEIEAQRARVDRARQARDAAEAK